MFMSHVRTVLQRVNTSLVLSTLYSLCQSSVEAKVKHGEYLEQRRDDEAH